MKCSNCGESIITDWFLLPNGKIFRKLRMQRKLTQAEVARSAGLSQSLIARVELGGIDPKLSTAKKILYALQAREKNDK